MNCIFPHSGVEISVRDTDMKVKWQGCGRAVRVLCSSVSRGKQASIDIHKEGIAKTLINISAYGRLCNYLKNRLLYCLEGNRERELLALDG